MHKIADCSPTNLYLSYPAHAFSRPIISIYYILDNMHKNKNNIHICMISVKESQI